MKKITGKVTIAELVGHVQYGYWYNALNESAYSKIAFACNFIQLVAGTGAFFTAFDGHQDLVKWLGLMVAICACISILANPSVNAEKHRAAKDQFLILESRAWNMKFDDLQSEIAILRSQHPTGIKSLGSIAFNKQVIAAGGDDEYIIPETFSRKLYKLLT